MSNINHNYFNSHLTVDERREMDGDSFSNRAHHFGASLRGTRQFWLKLKTRLTLIAMVDQR
jgi:hypothetical protein